MSSQAPPRPIISASSLFFDLYKFRRSVISISPLLEGFNFFESSTTLLSKKYKPVTAKSETNFFGFSLIRVILFFY